jgi:hypothetical protein
MVECFSEISKALLFGEQEEGKATPNDISRPARVFSAMRRVGSCLDGKSA